jgi:endogenous inhibitor of DNA gyrase (YacG/DUF329 family)
MPYSLLHYNWSVPRKRKVQLKCPTCKQKVAVGNEDFPFCSARCRLIDLGKWSSGTYVVASPIEDTEDLFQNSAIRKNESNEDE